MCLRNEAHETRSHLEGKGGSPCPSSTDETQISFVRSGDEHVCFR